jgi:two-component system, chemotaxis family, sensor kinase CheA
MDVEKFREMFLDEANDHLRLMVDQLLKLDADPEDSAAIDALFREAHSIKGMAATMDYHETAKLAHHLEDNLDRCRKEKIIHKAEIDRCLEATDLLEALLEDISTRKPEREVDGFIAAVESFSSEVEEKNDDTADHQRLLIKLTLKSTTVAPEARFMVLLKYLNVFGTILESGSEQGSSDTGRDGCMMILLETGASREELRQQLQKFSELELIEFPVEKIKESVVKKTNSGQTLRVNTDLLDHFINLTGELITNRYQLQNATKERDWAALDEGIGQLNRLVKNLHHQVLQVRMVALESLVGRTTRTLHDLCRSSGKEVQLKFEGTELELDRAIVEGLVNPLGHMVRNAVDHGIIEKGTITIRAWRERDQILLQFEDDGCGLNPEKIRGKAIVKKLLTPSQAQTIREYDLYQLICQPGFSTAEKVTETSGRGVGMDVVKTSVEQLGGILLIDSSQGEGTKITLKLPLSLAIIRVLLVECAEMVMALPITRVVQTLELSSDDIQSSGKQLMIEHQNELLPLLSLRKILKQPKARANDLIPIVITDILGRRVGLVVDQLVRQQEIFVQRLPAPFDRVRGCAGGTILGDGSIVFLLDIQSLLEKRSH